ncbi:MAG: ABC transporter ATP-binding protein [Promethearchaeota archaeon]
MIELENISKTFPGNVFANQDITLRIRAGEVHGLLGENGAGKTTLMNILYGLISKDSGTIKIRGEEVNFQSPHDAILVGIGMVHQHFKLIPPFTVTENVVLGSEPLFINLESRFEKAVIPTDIPPRNSAQYLTYQVKQYFKGLARSITGSVNRISPLNLKAAENKILHIAEENKLHIDPKEKIQYLSVGMQQRVEIIKVLYREAEILILDEPTAVLTPQEVDELFETLEEFRKAGKTIILISHKLREPIALCDRITVLRDGKLVGTVNKADTSAEQLAEMMVGRPVVFRVSKTKAIPGSSVLLVKDLHVKDDRGFEAVKGINLEVRSGEILGVAGVEGNGQQELVEALWGLRKPTSGEIFLEGELIKKYNPRKMHEHGIGYIPQDRHKRGLILDFSVKENLILGSQYHPPYSRGPLNLLLDGKQITNDSNHMADTYSIRIADINSAANTLSGGNQQKLIVARALAKDPKLIIASHPTRGLDVGAIEYIHKVLIEMRDKGVAVLLVSAELEEVRNIADRIAVIFEGQIVALRDPEKTDDRELGLLMAGLQSEQVGMESEQ